MLSESRIEELFREFLPSDVNIMNLSAETLTDQAVNHPYIQLQIQIGVYSPENIAEDFLSPARAHADTRLQVISTEVFDHLLTDIPDDIAEDYVRHVAAHEAHHFHKDHPPVSAAGHSASELECVREIMAAHPELNDAVKYVETNSPVYQRVYARLETIKRAVIRKNGAR